jgi:4,5-dihydroxyphthalate decarboxylase
MEDPRKVALAWFMNYWEEQKKVLGQDPWVYGIDENRENLENIILYAYEQGLIPKKFQLSELFLQGASEKSPPYLVKISS